MDNARALFGRDAVLWGRYFKGSGNVGGVHYNPPLENVPLAQRNIRVLPIAQQTGNVNGSEQQGRTDARNNVGALFSAFSTAYLAQQGGEFYMYLDVEGSPNPSLSAHYWTGWSQELRSFSRSQSGGTVSLLPGLYCNMDPATWQHLHQAEGTAPCSSVWLARWRQDPPSCLQPSQWNPNHVRPVPAPNAPVHLWQYAAECGGGHGFDQNEVTPLLSDADLQAYLARLILPPSGVIV